MPPQGCLLTILTCKQFNASQIASFEYKFGSESDWKIQHQKLYTNSIQYLVLPIMWSHNNKKR